ncbi:6-phospho-3-hexuloisomerase [Enterococcus canis]|nr:6-phospho-3-hexuloisomerase [Enterococcus canis]
MNDMQTILKEITDVLDKVDPQEVETAIELLGSGKRIFVLGEGRSGLQGKGFAMRLMHIGLTPFVIGESTTPSIQKDDVLVAISGSGTTSTIVSLAEKARKQGTAVLGITSKADSPLGTLASQVLVIPGATKTGNGKSIQLLSTLFDQTLHIQLDYICLELSRKLKVSNDDANKQHSNME